MALTTYWRRLTRALESPRPGSNPRHAFSQLCDFGPASVSSSVKCDLWGLCEESELVYCAWHTEYVQDKTRPPKCTQAEMGVRRAGGGSLDSVSFDD